MVELSSSKLGKIAETLVATQMMLASDGRLVPYLPMIDDDGIDLILHDRETSANLPIQVKARRDFDVKAAQTTEFNVRHATFRALRGGYTLALLLDETLMGVRMAWLIGDDRLDRVCMRKPKHWVMTPSAKPNSKDRYVPYRCNSLYEVYERLRADLECIAPDEPEVTA